jgi:hypothetical protein
VVGALLHEADIGELESGAFCDSLATPLPSTTQEPIAPPVGGGATITCRREQFDAAKSHFVALARNRDRGCDRVDSGEAAGRRGRAAAGSVPIESGDDEGGEFAEVVQMVEGLPEDVLIEVEVIVDEDVSKSDREHQPTGQPGSRPSPRRTSKQPA